MGKHVHTLTEKDFVAGTAVCAVDGPVRLVTYGNTYRCYVAYREHQNDMKRDRRTGLMTTVKDWTCTRCGFEAEALCQMDLDHIDGDRSNHAEENMQTLCSNCHRLKSFRPDLF